MKTRFLAMMAAMALACGGLSAEDAFRSQLEQVSSLKDFKPQANDFRVYFIGDSITRHCVKKELNWDHVAGMAASSEDKDYAHLVGARLGQLLPGKQVKLFFGQGKDAVNAMKGIADAKTYQPALVVVQLGEHVPSKAFGHNHDDSPEKIASDYGTLLDALKALPSKPMIICTGCWNPMPGIKKYLGRNAQIDEIQREVCRQKGVAFVSVEKYALDPSCSGSGGSGGVKWHPNDAGQAGYAKEIIAAFEKRQAAKPGDVVYEKRFDKDLCGWAPPGGAPWARIVPDGRGGNCVEISAAGRGEAGAVGNRDVLGKVEKSKDSTYLLTPGLAEILEMFKGYELEIEAGVKGDNLPVPPKPWDGVRVAANYTTSTSPYSDGYYNMLSGSFDWKNISYRVRIPSDMRNMSLSLGLIAPSGKVCYDHVKMTVTDIPLTMKTPPAGTAYTGYEVPRLRGFNTGIQEPGNENGRKSLDTMARDWKANVAKLWFFAKSQDFQQLDADLGKWMDSVEGALETAKADKLYLVLHFVAWWKVKEHGGNELFYEKPEYADKFVEMWKTIATRFKGRKEIYAFELLNESVIRMPIAPGCTDYPALMEHAAQAINAIDPERAIIVQTEEWWGPRAFYKMRPLDAKNIVYAVHFYSPFQVSHQGVAEFQAGQTSWTANAYPGTYDGIKWDKETLKRELQPARDFQKAYNVQIIVSEFGCIRWALGDSRRKLLTDMIDVYEEYGWDWLYHDYPGWPGWSPVLGDDPWDEKRPDTPTATETLLKSWFSKNMRPRF